MHQVNEAANSNEPSHQDLHCLSSKSLFQKIMDEGVKQCCREI